MRQCVTAVIAGLQFLDRRVLAGRGGAVVMDRDRAIAVAQRLAIYGHEPSCHKGEMTKDNQ
jgi:hypothetical protein